MKCKSLVLDERLLEEAVRVLGAKTCSAAVNRKPRTEMILAETSL